MRSDTVGASVTGYRKKIVAITRGVLATVKGLRSPSESPTTLRPRRTRIRSRLRQLLAAVACVFLVATGMIAAIRFAFPFPYERLADWPVSPRVEDRAGRPLLQIVADNDHWRFEVPLEDMSPWIVRATIAAEDERFGSHHGVDPTAICRAVIQNVDSGHVVSGASTLTMQLCRMVDPRPRRLSSKLVESVRALELERRLSKQQILEHYLNAVPYGGNVLGVEAASLRYFDRRACDLSLGQAALLAGLPRSPSTLRPDRYPERAVDRRGYVLRRMRELGMITPIQERDAVAEPVTTARNAERARGDGYSHVAWLALQRRPGGGRTTIDSTMQQVMASRVENHLERLPIGTDAAVVVLDIRSAAIVALIGSGDPSDPVDGQVNGALARRSPGSTLKPFIYAAAFESHRLNAVSVVHDVPLERGGWRPDNFDRSFRGPMTVTTALQQSRNVPAILVLEAMGVSRCHGVLNAAGVKLPASAASRGGLALAVGAVESSLFELTNAYATLGRDGIHCRPRLFVDEPQRAGRVLTAKTCRTISDILSTRHRTPGGLEDVPLDRLPWFMWKTGTSSGRRDAWAIGHNGRYAVGVWVGRFSGAGHPVFTGRDAAEPLLAELFSVPDIRRDEGPDPPQQIVVTRPLRLSPAKTTGPSITSPAEQAEFVCIDGQSAVVPISGSFSDNATWFLNGTVIRVLGSTSLRLSPGRYELRCVSQDGRSAAVQFSVSATGYPTLNSPAT